MKRLAEVTGIKCPESADDNSFGDTRDAVVDGKSILHLYTVPVLRFIWDI